MRGSPPPDPERIWEEEGVTLVEQVAKGRFETLHYSRRGRSSSRSEQIAKRVCPSREQLLESR